MQWFWSVRPMTSTELDVALSEADALFANQENTALQRALHRLERQTLPAAARWRVLLLRGWLHYRRSQSEAAIRCADTVLAETDAPLLTGAAHLLRAVSLEDQALARTPVDAEDLQPAIAECQQAVSLLAGSTEQLRAYYSLARLLADWHDPDEGIALLEQALQTSWPESCELGWTYARLGEIYALDKQDWRNGAQYLSQAAVRLDPSSKTHSWVHSLLAQCYNYLREPELAVIHGRHALELAARDKSSVEWVWVRAHKQYAMALTRAGQDLRSAEKHFRQAMRLTAKDSRLMAELYLELGNNLRWQERPRPAWRAIHRALQIDQDTAAAGGWYAIFAEIGFQLNQYRDVVRYTRLALSYKDFPADKAGETYYRLGVSLYKLGQYLEAAEALRLGLSKSPVDNPYRSAMLKWLLATNNRLSSASSTGRRGSSA